jgi:hypothetical protein
LASGNFRVGRRTHQSTRGSLEPPRGRPAARSGRLDRALPAVLGFVPHPPRRPSRRGAGRRARNGLKAVRDEIPGRVPRRGRWTDATRDPPVAPRASGGPQWVHRHQPRPDRAPLVSRGNSGRRTCPMWIPPGQAYSEVVARDPGGVTARHRRTHLGAFTAMHRSTGRPRRESADSPVALSRRSLVKGHHV